MSLIGVSVIAATQNRTSAQTTTSQKVSSAQTTSKTTTQPVKVQEAQKVESKVTSTMTSTKFMTNLKNSDDAKKISSKISSVSGVENVNVDVKTKIVTVTYNTKKTSNDKLIKKFDKINISAKIIK